MEKKLSKFFTKSVAFILAAAAVLSVCLLVGCDDKKDSGTSVTFTVSYFAEEGGRIEGVEAQQVTAGESASTVVAVAEEGWVFDGWSDGNTSAVRTDRNIQADAEYFAIFIPVFDDGTSGIPGIGDEDEPQKPEIGEGEPVLPEQPTFPEEEE